MRGLYNFIVKPKGNIYNNTKKINGVDLILNNTKQGLDSVFVSSHP